MAKFGKLVGEKELPFTIDEISDFKKHFKAILENNSIGIEFYMRTNYLDGKSYVINFDCKKIEKRNKLKNRIDFKGLSFIIRKKSGYIDLTDWNKTKTVIKDYINAPEYQYSVELICKGVEIAYRCRNKYAICLKNHYLFDTEISELNFKESLFDLFNNKLR